MQPSRLRSVLLPAAPSAARPTTVADAGDFPLRVLVRNIGALVAAFGYSSQDVAAPDGPSSESFRIPAGSTDVFVLAPRQKLFGVGIGGTNVVSVASSEALPLELLGR